MSQPLLLSGDSIGSRDGNKTIRLGFGSQRPQLEGMVASWFTDPPVQSDNAECGAGPMAFSAYPGGLTLNYQDGKLVGWQVDEPSSVIVLENGLGIGAPLAQAEALPGFTRIEDSTLGDEFYSEDEGIGGFIEDGNVASLYAGTTCFFR